MENPGERSTQDGTPWRLPRRDYVILPLLCLFTGLLMLGMAEAASRIVFAQHEKDACMLADPVLGTRFEPNCVSHVKSAEGPWVTNSYNACGFRTPQSCGPTPAGDVRIAVLGSSFAQGYLVPYNETFAARASEELERRCKRPVEFQNLASIGYVWQRLAVRADDALPLKPDAAVIVLVPFDLQQTEQVPTAVAVPDAGEGTMKRVESLLLNSRAVVAAQHFMFSRPDLYVPLYLHYGDRADFLRQPLTPAWQHRLDDFDRLLGGIADKYHAANVPLLLAYVPQQAQAELLAAGHSPPGVDPSAFGRLIGEVAARHGVNYVDLSQVVADMPNVGRLYYAVDGHLSPQGHDVLAKQVAAALQHDVPAFANCASSGAMAQSASR